MIITSFRVLVILHVATHELSSFKKGRDDALVPILHSRYGDHLAAIELATS